MNCALQCAQLRCPAAWRVAGGGWPVGHQGRENSCECVCISHSILTVFRHGKKVLGRNIVATRPCGLAWRGIPVSWGRRAMGICSCPQTREWVHLRDAYANPWQWARACDHAYWGLNLSSAILGGHLLHHPKSRQCSQPVEAKCCLGSHRSHNPDIPPHPTQPSVCGVRASDSRSTEAVAAISKLVRLSLFSFVASPKHGVLAGLRPRRPAKHV